MSTQSPERHLTRHALVDRVFHWLMAATMLALLATSLVPIAGVQFAWVTPHWVAGIVLVLAVVFHIVRALFWQSMLSMWIEIADIRDLWLAFLGAFSKAPAAPGKPGKYSLAQKLYHHVITVITLIASGTGLAMMVKVDTPFWQRDPYWLSADTWGIVYVLHGASAVGLITMIMLHIYFALRPEKLWYTRSMIKGWMTQKEYLTNHDASRWKINDPEINDPSITTFPPPDK